MSRTLLILRHAKSSWSDPDLADFDRPLNKRGRSDAPRVGRLLAEEELVPDLVLCSTATRARETLTLMRSEVELSAPVHYADDLYHAAAATTITCLANMDPDVHTVLLIGHNPGLEATVQELTGAYERLPTAAMAMLELRCNEWSGLVDSVEPPCRLVELWRPKELPG